MLKTGLIVAAIGWVASLLLTVQTAVAAGDAAAVQFFENAVRPVLAERCYKCHGPEKQKGGLRVDSLGALLSGGDSGAVLTPGEPEQSLLIKAIRYGDPNLQMPPKQKLSDKEVNDLVRWVKIGAPWPGSEAGAVPMTVKPAGMQITEADRAHWSFLPIRRPAAPPVKRADWINNPIDAFVLSKLEQKGLEPNEPADKRALIRRATMDLTGLPPTAEEIDAFLKDSSPGAYEKVIDRLLASPRYGEHWARYWLDLVRYGQTNGYERDSEKPLAWRYRDYVIRALNADKPYDRFVKEQLAGDELENVNDDSIIATGFYRLGVWDDEPDDKKTAEYDELDDNVRTISTAFMGLTIGCARCHDHKFDPISQADYYRLLAFIHNVRPLERPRFSLDSSNYLPLGDRAEAEKWFAEQEAQVKAAQEELEGLKQKIRHELKEKSGVEAEVSDEAFKKAFEESAERKKLEERIREIQSRKAPVEWALAAVEAGAKPRKTHVLVRGNAATPGAEVRGGFPTVLMPSEQATVQSHPTSRSTGLRRALAEWLISPQNPLTARVMVNRIWQHHFGRGIVRTPDDFGRTGTPPTHPDLLDWLASEFMSNGWSIKQMHRVMMTSSTYKMSSRVDARKAAVDAPNDLFWRQSIRRLRAESIRDSVLAVSGQLNHSMGGRGFFPRLSREVIAGGSRPGEGWEISRGEELHRRSIYAFVKRTMLVPMLETFDFNNTAMPSGERTETTVAPQALLLLNDDFMHQQAEALASRLAERATGDHQRQIEAVYRLVLGRLPDAEEMRVAKQFLERQERAFAAVSQRLSFRPAAPSALSSGFLSKLDRSDFLSGPRGKWIYGRGAWGAAYEGIVNLDVKRGPFALAGQTRFADGLVEARLLMQPGCEMAGLIVRAMPDGAELFKGYDVVFDVREEKLLLRRHDPNVQVLAAVPCIPKLGQWQVMRIEVAGLKIRVWLDGSPTPVIDVTDEKPPTAEGHAGVRTWGAALDVEALSVTANGARTVLVEERDPARRALTSLCLLVLNLNEFVYID